MRKVEKHNDKAGIIFLIALIGTVFLVDFFIEISKMNKTDLSVNNSQIETRYFNPEFQTDPLFDPSSSENIFYINSEQATTDSRTRNRAMLQISFILLVLASFSHFPTCSFRYRSKIIKIFSYYISFINNIFQNTALPRPPPRS